MRLILDPEISNSNLGGVGPRIGATSNSLRLVIRFPNLSTLSMAPRRLLRETRWTAGNSSRYVTHRKPLLARLYQRHHSVIRCHEDIVVRLRENRPSRAAHAGINHDHMHGARRKEPIRLRNRPGTLQHGMGSHGMGHINNSRLWMNAQYDAMHDPDKRILEPKVGSKGNNPRLGHRFEPIRMARPSQANKKPPHRTALHGRPKNCL